MDARDPLTSESDLTSTDPPERSAEVGLNSHSAARERRTVPHLGDALFFSLVAAFFIFATEAGFFWVAMSRHLLAHESAAEMAKEPKLVLPAMALSYLLTLLVAWLFFPLLWQRSFAQGISFHSGIAIRLRWRLIPAGMALGLVVQWMQNFLPMPKTVPMDDFFKTLGDVWMVTIFGTLLAPLFEEIAFRGMLLPAIANAWDWVGSMGSDADEAAPGGQMIDFDPSEVQFSPDFPGSAAIAAAQPIGGGLIFSAVLTSLLFALLHADQLAHSFAPLGLLFCVSLALTFVRIKTGSVAASALVHASYNFVVFLAMFIATGGYRHLDKLKT